MCVYYYKLDVFSKCFAMTLGLILFSRCFSQFSTLCGQHFSSRCGREIRRHLPTNGVQLAQMISKKLDLRIMVN